MTNSDAAKPKRVRKRTGTLSKQRTLRFGAAEEAAIEAVRSALSKTRGKKVSFSEAHRVLLLDKEEAARIEARALAMGSGPVGDSADVVAALEKLAEEAAQLRMQVARVGGNLNQVSRRLNSGEDVPAVDVSEALSAVAALRYSAKKLDDAGYQVARSARGY